jgi:hypothetical protein
MRARLLGSLHCLFAARRSPDANGGGDRFGFLHRMTQHQGRRPGSLYAQQARQAVTFEPMVLLEAHPVGGDIPRIAYRQAKQVGGFSQCVADFESGGLLPFQAVRVERVDQGNGVFLRDRHHQAEGVIEGAAHLHHLGAVSKCAG